MLDFWSNALRIRQNPIYMAFMLAFIVLFELIAVSLSFDARPLAHSSLPIVAWLGYAGVFLHISILFAVIFFLLNLNKLYTVFLPFKLAQTKNGGLWLGLHVLFLAIFGYLTFLLFTHNAVFSNHPDFMWLGAGLSIAWLVSGCTCMASLLLSFWPISVWWQFLRRQWPSMTIALVTAILGWGMAIFAQSAWHELATLTFVSCKALLGLFYEGIVSDLTTKSLGTRTFQVEISPQCSGYEGMGMVSVFLTLYIWTAQKQLRFPHAILLYPIGITLIWLMNILRISLLIILGTEWSPAVAIGGFHSNAGWIAFNSISVGIVLLAQHVRFFAKQSVTLNHQTAKTNPALPILLPFTVLMACILIFGAFSSGFDWLYPLKVIICILVLWSFRISYKKLFKGLTVETALIGTIVFIFWIAIVSTSSQIDASFNKALLSVPVVWQWVWLFFRILGAVITIPLIEELAFRGYVLPKLIQKDFENVSPKQFTVLSFTVSSILFGALHGDYLAGSLAGMAYALALYQRGVLGDAIFAHAITNALLAAYVLVTQHWSLW